MSVIASTPISSSTLQEGLVVQQSINVHLQTFSPLPRTINLELPAHTSIHDILEGLSQALNLSPSTISSLRVTTQSNSSSIPFASRLSSIQPNVSNLPLTLVVHHALVGGKGGFGSMLRAQGGKMGKNQDNNDSCRDLNGRRLSTMKEAKKLAAYLEGAEARQKALDEKQRKKYAKLERILGRAPKSSSDFETAATRLADAGEELEKDDNSNGSEEDEGEEGGKVAESSAAGAKRNAAAATSSKSKSTSTSKADEQVVGQKRKERFDDHEFVEQSREIVDNVRSAVASAMLKKRKKAALAKSKGSSKPQAV